MERLTHCQLALLRHALRHAGFRYTVVSHQSSHGVTNQTDRSDLQNLAGRDLLIPGKDAIARFSVCHPIWLLVFRAELSGTKIGGSIKAARPPR
jgi:hypothetical protein